jgi:hypothetical protein
MYLLSKGKKTHHFGDFFTFNEHSHDQGPFHSVVVAPRAGIQLACAH